MRTDFYAATLVAFFWVLNISELVAQSRSTEQTEVLLFQDIQFTEGGVSIMLR